MRWLVASKAGLLPSREGQKLPDSRFRDAEVFGNLRHRRPPLEVLNDRVSLHSCALQDTTHSAGNDLDDGAI